MSLQLYVNNVSKYWCPVGNNRKISCIIEWKVMMMYSFKRLWNINGVVIYSLLQLHFSNKYIKTSPCCQNEALFSATKAVNCSAIVPKWQLKAHKVRGRALIWHHNDIQYFIIMYFQMFFVWQRPIRASFNVICSVDVLANGVISKRKIKETLFERTDIDCHLMRSKWLSQYIKSNKSNFQIQVRSS